MKTNVFGNYPEDAPPILIAEIGVNHNGDVGLAKEMVHAAIDAGADAVKFQMYRTEALVVPSAEKAEYQKQTTGTDDVTQWQMLKQLELSVDQHSEIADFCLSRSIHYVCTPYDIDSARLLTHHFPISALKVASSDATNIPFLLGLDECDVPVILSTGMCDMAEVEIAFGSLSGTVRRGQLTILQCTSEYPAPLAEANLRSMVSIGQCLGVPIGFSDHTSGTLAAIAATALGARVIEKHFTLDKSLPGPDHRASLTPSEFGILRRDVDLTFSSLGADNKPVTASEVQNKAAMQKSLYYSRKLSKGHVISTKDLCAKRPADGLEPSVLGELRGKALDVDVLQNDLVSMEHFA